MIKPKTYAILTLKDDRYVVQLMHPEGTTLLHDTTLPLGFAMGVAEDYARENGDSLARRDARWRKDSATEKQMEFLRKLHVEIPPDGLSKGEASLLIDQAVAKRKNKNRKVM